MESGRETFDLKRVCRTCEGTKKLILVDKVPGIHRFLHVNMDLQPMPQQEAICSYCVELISIFKKFLKRGKETDRKLRAQLASKRRLN